MALNIRSSSESSSSDSTQSSSKRTSSSDLFAQDMARSAQASGARPRQPAPAPKAARPANPPPKPKHSASESGKSHSKPAKTGAASSESDSGNELEASRKLNSGSQPKASGVQASADAQSGQDAAAPEEAAAASAANELADGMKGRATARTASKSSSGQDVAAKNALARSTDPSADSTDESGFSLLQMLARSLESDNTNTAPTDDAAAPAATDKSSAGNKATDDPNAIALAMFTQALAAALGTNQTPITNAASADSGDTTTGITSATQSPAGSASMQDLMTVLAHELAADSKGKSDDAAAQSNADPAKGAASGTGGTDTSAVGPGALAHLGAASHFAVQRLRNDTNTAAIESPVGSSAWADEVGAQLTWMTQKGLETGSLRVSPEHLGPVEVNISVHNGDASVWFVANHPDTRAALEQALPRLREMFAGQGMNLADSGVSRQSLSQQGSRNQTRSGASQAVAGVSAVGAADGNSAAAARINLGLVDLYA